MMMGNEDVGGDRFPVGMRVLAVDDDLICLKVLEKLLRKCKYNVTTTTQSVKALEILRENRNKFDLVISDVNMPDMDGFQLLELVGLEMDLPVIMLSGFGDKESVMRGVKYGACDYLVKPVRIEELQNIWQHVVRRKIDGKDKNKSTNEEKAYNLAREGSLAIVSENNADHNRKLCRKRKEQSEAEVGKEDDQENEEPHNHKKSRLVWNTELHSKFVAAVNQLGLDKAFPKKILDLMNVEGLTRENVASHLQKYRLGLKKPTQQAAMVSALCSSDPYLHMGLPERYGDFRLQSGGGRMLNTTLPSYASGGMFRRHHSSSGLNIRGITSSGLLHPVQPKNINSSINALGNMSQSMFTTNQTSNSLQGIPTSMKVKQNNCTSGIRKLSPIDGFSDSRAAVSNGNNFLPGLSNNDLLLQRNPTPAHNLGAFRNHSSLGAASLNAESFGPAMCGGSSILNYDQCNESWDNAAQISNGSLISPVVSTDFLGHSLDQNETVCSKRINASLVGQLNGVNPSFPQSSEVEKLHSMQSNDASTLQQIESQEGLVQNSFESSDMRKLVNMEQNWMTLMDGEMEFDDTLLNHVFDPL